MHPERARVRSLDDVGLIRAMRTEDRWAWDEFVSRARPVLETCARRARLRDDEWLACVDDLLDDVAMHLVHPRTTVPSHLGGYLATAATLRLRQVLRNRSRSDARDLAMITPQGAAVVRELSWGVHAESDTSGVVLALSSAHARRAIGPDGGVAVSAVESAEDEASPLARGGRRLTEALAAEFRAADLDLLVWHAMGVTYAEAARWLGISPSAAAKRVARLDAKIVARARALATTFPADEHEALERVRRRGLTVRDPAAMRSPTSQWKSADLPDLGSAVDVERVEEADGLESRREAPARRIRRT